MANGTDEARTQGARTKSSASRSGRLRKRTTRNTPTPPTHNRKALIRMTMGFLAVSMIVILVTISMYFRAGSAARVATVDSRSLTEVLNGGSVEFPQNTVESLDPEEAAMLVKTALSNRDPALVAGHFILGSSAATPEEAIALLDSFEIGEGSPDGLEPIGGRPVSDRIVEEVVVSSVKDGYLSNRVAQLVPERGEWRIDLDSYARLATPGWEEILGGKCKNATVRVFVNADNYYNGEIFPESLWKCYGVISPDVDEILFGYVARGSAQDKALDAILLKEEANHKATLGLKLTGGCQSRMQFQISEVLADDWLVGSAGFDESF